MLKRKRPKESFTGRKKRAGLADTVSLTVYSPLFGTLNAQELDVPAECSGAELHVILHVATGTDDFPQGVRASSTGPGEIDISDDATMYDMRTVYYVQIYNDALVARVTVYSRPHESFDVVSLLRTDMVENREDWGYSGTYYNVKGDVIALSDIADETSPELYLHPPRDRVAPPTYRGPRYPDFCELREYKRDPRPFERLNTLVVAVPHDADVPAQSMDFCIPIECTGEILCSRLCEAIGHDSDLSDVTAFDHGTGKMIIANDATPVDGGNISYVYLPHDHVKVTLRVYIHPDRPYREYKTTIGKLAQFRDDFPHAFGDIIYDKEGNHVDPAEPGTDLRALYYYPPDKRTWNLDYRGLHWSSESQYYAYRGSCW